MGPIAPSTILGASQSVVSTRDGGEDGSRDAMRMNPTLWAPWIMVIRGAVVRVEYRFTTGVSDVCSSHAIDTP
jgi:hypothetical protein